MILRCNSPGIFSPKVGQPVTNCKRRFFNGFRCRDLSSIHIKSLRKSEWGKVTKNELFESPETRLRVLSVVSFEFKATCSMGYQRQRQFLVFPP